MVYGSLIEKNRLSLRPPATLLKHNYLFWASAAPIHRPQVVHFRNHISNRMSNSKQGNIILQCFFKFSCSEMIKNVTRVWVLKKPWLPISPIDNITIINSWVNFSWKHFIESFFLFLTEKRIRMGSTLCFKVLLWSDSIKTLIVVILGDIQWLREQEEVIGGPKYAKKCP